MSPSRSYSEPGHAVFPVSLWPCTRPSSTFVPLVYRGDPRLVSTTVPAGSKRHCAPANAATRAIALTASTVGAALVMSPSRLTPSVPVLKPCACEPITARSTPPARPSQMPPYLSTTRL